MGRKKPRRATSERKPVRDAGKGGNYVEDTPGDGKGVCDGKKTE